MGQSRQQTSNAQENRNERRQYWTSQVQQCKRSGLTQKEYSIREGISVERLGTWKRRLDREKQNNGTKGLVAVPAKTVTSALFMPPTVLGLVVDEQYRIEIPEAFCPATLESVLQVLRRI